MDSSGICRLAWAMMTLSDRELRAAMSRGSVRITPLPTVEMYSSMAVDLTLGTELRKWKDPSAWGLESRIRPSNPRFSVPSLLDNLTDHVLSPTEG